MSDNFQGLESYFSFRKFIHAFLKLSFCRYRNEFSTINEEFSGAGFKTFWLSLLLIANLVAQSSINGKGDLTFYSIFPYTVVGVAAYLIVGLVISIFLEDDDPESMRYYLNILLFHMILLLAICLMATLANLRFTVNSWWSYLFAQNSGQYTDFLFIFIFCLASAFIVSIRFVINARRLNENNIQIFRIFCLTNISNALMVSAVFNNFSR